jgi:hypothetical protein
MIMRNKNNMFFFQNLKINSKIILKINLFYISTTKIYVPVIPILFYLKSVTKY